MESEQLLARSWLGGEKKPEDVESAAPGAEGARAAATAASTSASTSRCSLRGVHAEPRARRSQSRVTEEQKKRTLVRALGHRVMYGHQRGSPPSPPTRWSAPPSSPTPDAAFPPRPRRAGGSRSGACWSRTARRCPPASPGRPPTRWSPGRSGRRCSHSWRTRWSARSRRRARRCTCRSTSDGGSWPTTRTPW